MKATRKRETDGEAAGGAAGAAALPTVCVAALVAREGDGWRVRAGRRELVAAVDASVDPAMLDEALREGARVVVELTGAEAVVVGALQTRRALRVSPEGDVDVAVRRFAVRASDEARLQSPGAFVRAQGEEVEVYGARVLTRARELARVLARMIKLN